MKRSDGSYLNAEPKGGPWTSHGHVISGVTIDGTGRPPVARCGGPNLCGVCGREAAAIRRGAAQNAESVPRMDAPKPRYRVTLHLEVLGKDDEPVGVEQWVRGVAHVVNSPLQATSLVSPSPIMISPIAPPVWDVRWIRDEDGTFYTIYGMNPEEPGPVEIEWVVMCGRVVVVCSSEEEAHGTAARFNRHGGEDSRMPPAQVASRPVRRGALTVHP